MHLLLFFSQSFLYILCTTFLMHSYKKSWNCCSFVFTEIRSWYFNPILLKGFCLLRCKITRFDSIKIFTAHIWYKCKYQIFPISNVPIWYLVLCTYGTTYLGSKYLLEKIFPMYQTVPNWIFQKFSNTIPNQFFSFLWTKKFTFFTKCKLKKKCSFFQSKPQYDDIVLKIAKKEIRKSRNMPKMLTR